MDEVVKQLVMACVTAGVIAVVVSVLGRLAFFRAGVERHGAIVPPAIAAAAIAGFLMIYDTPKWMEPRLWQSPLYAAALAGIFLPLALGFKHAIVRWCIVTGVVLGAATVVAFSAKVHAGNPDPRLVYVGLMVATGIAVSAVALPLAGRTAGAFPIHAALVPAFAAVVYMFFRGNDTANMRISMLFFAVFFGMALIALIPWLAGAARGAAVSGGVMLAAFGVVGAHYANSPMDEWRWLWVFPALAPLAVGVAYIPAVAKRTWLAHGLAAVVALAILAPAIVLTHKHALPLE